MAGFQFNTHSIPGYDPSVKKNNRLWWPGYSDIRFDVNGHASSALDRVGNRNIQYVTVAQGTILVRDEITDSIERPNYRYNSAAFNPGSVANKVTRYYYVDGKRVGDVSNDGASPRTTCKAWPRALPRAAITSKYWLRASYRVI